jgi:hypothetical protein
MCRRQRSKCCRAVGLSQEITVHRLSGRSCADYRCNKKPLWRNRSAKEQIYRSKRYLSMRLRGAISTQRGQRRLRPSASRLAPRSGPAKRRDVTDFIGSHMYPGKHLATRTAELISGVTQQSDCDIRRTERHPYIWHSRVAMTIIPIRMPDVLSGTFIRQRMDFSPKIPPGANKDRSG